MTLQRVLLTSTGNLLTILSDDSQVIEHFSNPIGHADIVINQINHENIYKEVFGNKTDLVILDIGANIGLFSLHAQDRAKIIYAIEPTPDHFSILTKLTENYANIHPIKMAIHDNNYLVEFFVNEENSTMNSSVNQYSKKIIVPGHTVNWLLTTHNVAHVDIVKCDIEGSEMIALTDQTVGEVRDRVDTWFVEIHETPAGSIDHNRRSLATMFVRQGYQVYSKGHDGLIATKL